MSIRAHHALSWIIYENRNIFTFLFSPRDVIRGISHSWNYSESWSARTEAVYQNHCAIKCIIFFYMRLLYIKCRATSTSGRIITLSVVTKITKQDMCKTFCVRSIEIEDIQFLILRSIFELFHTFTFVSLPNIYCIHLIFIN